MSSKKWRPETTVHFIEEYEKYPCLWDPKNREYKRREVRIFALQQIINTLAKSGVRMSLDGAKTKIRNLRNTYINELRKMAESKLSGTEKVYKTSLYWFKEADRFLRNVVKIPDTVAQNCDVESEEEILPDTDGRDVIIEFLQPVEEDSGGSVLAEDNDKIDFSPQPPTLVCEKKPPVTAPLIQQLQVKRKVSTAEPERTKRITHPPLKHETSFAQALPDDDEFGYFGQSIALQMKKLPLEYALELQAEIQSAVVQKRLKVLRKADRQIVGSSSENQSSFSKGTVMNVSEDSAIRVSLETSDDQDD